MDAKNMTCENIPSLNDSIINAVCEEAANELPRKFGPLVNKAILYGSCARGDYNSDSDIDIAVLVDAKRNEIRPFQKPLAQIAADLDLKYFVVVNFACLPYEDFEEIKSWHPYYKNVETEGRLIYGQ